VKISAQAGPRNTRLPLHCRSDLLGNIDQWSSLTLS
jgi:hypothetical protein